MINELYNLAKALSREGVKGVEWHREYKEIPKVTVKAPCIRIWLADDGAVCGMESLSAELAGTLRKYGNNQGTFPAFNISPLYRVVHSEVIAELERMEAGQCKPDIEKIKSWCSIDNWIKGTPGKVRRSLKDCPENLSKLLNLKDQKTSNVIAKLVEICANTPDNFRTSLEHCAFEKLKNEEEIKIVLALLFHKGSAEKAHDKDTGSNISIILDVKNWELFGYKNPVANEHTTDQFNEMLLASGNPPNEIEAENKEVDAFGTPFVNPGEPMPSVKLSGLFDVALRSMFDGQPCQHRYGQINDGSYPIAAENRSAIKRSLEWISDLSDRQHITWEKIDKKEIAFIYPSKLPEVLPKFISIFGHSPSENVKKAEVRFEEIAKEFAKTFRGLLSNQKPEMLQVFTIRKMDKARSKVIFTHNTTPEQLIQAADNWSIGCRNLPELDVGECITPFPLKIADIVNAVWKQNGERAHGKTPVSRMKYYQGMELLLDILPPAALHYFLHIHMENISGLIHYLGNRMHCGGKCETKAEYGLLNKQKADAAQACSILCLLLFKCNIRKENYMKELSYLLGQLLHVSDELHILYCKVKRDGDVPPQLAGSALFVAAGEVPYQALSQLSVRTNPYISWAKQYRHKNIDKKGEESWRARWLLNLFEQLSDQILPQMDKTIRFGDFEKSQLFIGYMASLPKKKQADQATETDNITGDTDNEQ